MMARKLKKREPAYKPMPFDTALRKILKAPPQHKTTKKKKDGD